MSDGASGAVSSHDIETAFSGAGTFDLKSFLDQRPDMLVPAVVEQLGELVRQRVRVDVEEALRFAQAAVAIAERLQDRPSLGRSSRAMGNALWFKGDHRAAVGFFDKAATDFESAEMPTEVARTLSSSIQVLALLGEYERAFAAAAKARDIFDVLGDEWRKARLELNVANIHHRQDRFADALAVYERAYADLLRWKDSEGVGVALHNMAVCLIMLNDFQRALDCYERARELCREHGMPLLEVQAEYNIAYLHFIRGDYDAARKALSQTRERSRDAGDAYHQALCDLDEAEIYLELNLVDEAARMAEEATRRFTELGLGFETGRSLANLALAKHRLRNSGRALELLADAKAVFEKENNPAWLALIDLYRAVILCERAQYVDARQLAESARETFRRLGLDRREIICDLLLARVSLGISDPQHARGLLQKALARLTTLDAPQLAFQAHVLLGDAARLSGNLSDASRSYDEARTQLETLRSSIQGEELKISFLEDKARVYRNLVELCLQTSDSAPDSVLRYIEQAKSRTLLERFVWPVPGLNSLPIEGSAGDPIQSLRRELNWLYRRLELEQTSREEVSIDRVTTLRTEVRQKEDSFVRILRDLNSRDDLQTHHHAVPLNPRDIRDALHEDAAIVEYFEAGGDFVAVVVKHDRTEIVRLAPMQQVNTHVRMLEFQLAKFRLGHAYPDAFQAQLLAATQSRLQELYRDLIAPLESTLDRRHLVVVPHDVLHYVPFHALYDGSAYLIDRFTVSVAPSAGIYTMCTRRTANAGGGVLLLGLHDDKAPFIEREIQSVAAVFDEARVFLGEEATTEVLRTVGRESSIVHVATHGVFRRDNPMFSSIRMADGYMTLYDLYQLRLPVELLTLSGCGTGLNVVAAGDELLGLTRGLLGAGAQSVLLSLWDVHDFTTSEFMSSFYRHFGQSRQKAVALRLAVLETRERQPHPYFWAPFVLVGKALN